MFEYCRGRHVDPSYMYFGTVDFGILDPARGIALMYSMVSMGGQWFQLLIYPPYQFEDLASRVSPKAKNLHDYFEGAKLIRGMTLNIECLKVKPENLVALALKDAASLLPEDQASLESVIGEVF